MRSAVVLPIFLSSTIYITASPVAREKRQNVYPQGPSDAVVLDLPTANPIPPPTATGAPYGTEALLGSDGNSVQGSAVVQNYQLVPGQLETPTDGLELDFNIVEKPQPIRGTSGLSGATDPGPGMFLSSSIPSYLTT